MNAVQLSFFTTTDTRCRAGLQTEQHPSDDVSTKVRTTSTQSIRQTTEDFDRGDYEVEPALLYRTICFLSGFIYI